MKRASRDISVIICAYSEKRWDALVTAVESLKQQSLPPEEVIVVIDHNASLLTQAQAHISGVTVIENTGMPGLSDSRNSGIAVAKGELIAFLDDDAVATSHWLKMLNEGFTHPQVLGIGGKVTPLWLDKGPCWLPEEFYWVIGCTYRGIPRSVQTIRNPIGANMAFRREIFDTIGGFRHGIGRTGTWPAGCEETEFCIRARQHWPHGVFLYQPQANVFHRIQENRTSWHYFCERCYAEGHSKAVVTLYVGAKDSLSSELTYTFRTLPTGILHGIADGFLRLDMHGFQRTGAIIAGFTMTVVGYVVESIFLRLARSKKYIVQNNVLLRTQK